jgi:hypothetical protein
MRQVSEMVLLGGERSGMLCGPCNKIPYKHVVYDFDQSLVAIFF